jgi:hypothetical protein
MEYQSPHFVQFKLFVSLTWFCLSLHLSCTGIVRTHLPLLSFRPVSFVVVQGPFLTCTSTNTNFFAITHSLHCL